MLDLRCRGKYIDFKLMLKFEDGEFAKRIHLIKSCGTVRPQAETGLAREACMCVPY